MVVMAHYVGILAVCGISSATIGSGHNPGLSMGARFKGARGPGIFFRVSWATEVPQSQLDDWFGLVAQGRAEGPSSPYFVSELALQEVASGVWPPEHANKPGTMFTEELAKLAKYFPLFDTVYIGTLLLPRTGNASYWENYAAAQKSVAERFLNLYPLARHPNFAWYITDEGCIEQPSSVAQLLELSSAALNSVAPLPILWSPAVCEKFDTLPGNPPGSELEPLLEKLFCSKNLTVPVAIHFQDHVGVTSTFQFPFYYNYTMTSDDALGYYRVLKRVSAKCPMLREVKVNMEMFVEHHNPEGQGGEINGAFILDGDPREVGTRRRVYEAQAEIGVCWAMPHWFNLNTFANRTMNIQCTEQQLKNGTCTHPYFNHVPVGRLSSHRTGVNWK